MKDLGPEYIKNSKVYKKMFIGMGGRTCSLLVECKIA